MNPTNSPMPQQSNLPDFNPPQTEIQATAEELSYSKVGESKGWEQLKEYYEKRKKHFSQYLPGGDSISNLSGVELEAWVKAAATIIEEHDNVIQQIEAITNAVKKAK